MTRETTKMDVRELINHAPKQVMPYFDIGIYPKGNSTLVPDAKNSSLYLLLEEATGVYQYTLDGILISLYRYDKNSRFGEAEFYRENQTTLGISVIDIRRIVKLSRKGVETWIREDSGFCEFLLRQMALKVAENSDAYIRSSSMELEDRVLYCLYRHGRTGTLSDLVKERLMNEVCTPVRSLNRVLVQCREGGLAAYDKHRFRIMDEERSLDAADRPVGGQR